MYLETSSGQFNDTARLISPPITDNSIQCFTFWYVYTYTMNSASILVIFIYSYTIIKLHKKLNITKLLYELENVPCITNAGITCMDSQ